MLSLVLLAGAPVAAVAAAEALAGAAGAGAAAATSGGSLLDHLHHFLLVRPFSACLLASDAKTEHVG